MQDLANKLTNLSHEIIADMQEKYSLFDPDDDGSLLLEKMRSLIKANIPGITDEIFDEICLVNKIDPCGKITFAQFVVLHNAITRLPVISAIENASDFDSEKMIILFNELDEDKSGYVDMKVFLHVMRNTGDKLNEEEAAQLELHMNLVGCVLNNKVNYRAFLRNILTVTPVSLV